MAGTKSVFLAKTMNLNTGTSVTKYEGGKSHEIPVEWADSDYVRQHMPDPPDMPPKEGTPEWAAHKRDKEAAQILLDRVLAQQATKNMQSSKRGR